MVQDVFLALFSRKDFNEVAKLFDAAYYTGDFGVLEQEELIRREEEIEKLPEQRREY